MSQRGPLQMLQHQVYNIFFSKFFRDINYFLFVYCIPTTSRICLKSLLQSIPLPPVISIALNALPLATSLSNFLRQYQQNHFTFNRLPAFSACKASALESGQPEMHTGLMQWILMNVLTGTAFIRGGSTCSCLSAWLWHQIESLLLLKFLKTTWKEELWSLCFRTIYSQIRLGF